MFLYYAILYSAKLKFPEYFLKAGLSGIVKQHVFETIQDFYTAFYTAQHATDTYKKAYDKWEKDFGEQTTPKAETMHKKIKRYQEKADWQNANQLPKAEIKGRDERPFQRY